VRFEECFRASTDFVTKANTAFHLRVHMVICPIKDVNSGGTLAGNYGFARRASRGLRASQGASPSASEQSAVELVEQRLQHVEQELVDTKAEIKGLREIVEKLSLKVS